MAIRVIYGTEIDTTVPSTLTPEAIIDSLKTTYKELSDSEYTLSDDGEGGSVMRITLKQGRKAAAWA
jgi:hypothetical protein